MAKPKKPVPPAVPEPESQVPEQVSALTTEKQPDSLYVGEETFSGFEFRVRNMQGRVSDLREKTASVCASILDWFNSYIPFCRDLKTDYDLLKANPNVWNRFLQETGADWMSPNERSKAYEVAAWSDEKILELTAIWRQGKGASLKEFPNARSLVALERRLLKAAEPEVPERPPYVEPLSPVPVVDGEYMPPVAQTPEAAIPETQKLRTIQATPIDKNPKKAVKESADAVSKYEAKHKPAEEELADPEFEHGTSSQPSSPSIQCSQGQPQPLYPASYSDTSSSPDTSPSDVAYAEYMKLRDAGDLKPLGDNEEVIFQYDSLVWPATTEDTCTYHIVDTAIDVFDELKRLKLSPQEMQRVTSVVDELATQYSRNPSGKCIRIRL
jgi:hypothetical protein